MTVEAVPGRPLRLLLVEDRDDDALLLLHALQRGGYAVDHHRVETGPDLETALTSDEWDLVISDFSMPTLTAMDVLDVIRQSGRDVPCIVISGTIEEEAAVDLLRSGARDFIVKERLVRLLPAIERELKDFQVRRRHAKAEASLRETRERMEFALEMVGVGTWEADVRTGVTTWSPALERLHGLEPGAFEGTTEAFLELIHPDDRAQVHDYITRSRIDRADVRIEYRVPIPEGEPRWLLGLGRTLVNDQGKPLRAVGVGLDITSQKHLEDQLRQMQRIESIGNIAGGVAHDFNNLLAVIMGYCELLLERFAGDAGATADLGEIRHATDSASALTRQLLAFSRRQVLEPKTLDLSQEVRSFQGILRRIIEENVQLEFALADDLRAVNADPRQIEQVLLNLAANARDAMSTGGTLTISTENVVLDASYIRTYVYAREGPHVLLAVRDTGSGIPKHVLPRVFEPFFTTKERGQGTGLGLSTVYGIVRQSGGHVNLYSEAGRGTVVRVYLPAVDTALTPREQAAANGDHLTGTETVLVIEDDPRLRGLDQRVLENYGYTVLIAEDAVQARAIVGSHAGPIHVAVIDVIMPGEGGGAIGRWLAETRPDTHIIYVSGYTGDAVAREGLVTDGTLFLQKPFSPIELARKVREAVEKGYSA